MPDLLEGDRAYQGGGTTPPLLDSGFRRVGRKALFSPANQLPRPAHAPAAKEVAAGVGSLVSEHTANQPKTPPKCWSKETRAQTAAKARLLLSGGTPLTARPPSARPRIPPSGSFRIRTVTPAKSSIRKVPTLNPRSSFTSESSNARMEKAEPRVSVFFES